MIKLKNYNIKENELHPFHLVRPSPWPITVSFSLFFFLMGLVKWMHNLDYAQIFLHFGGIGLTFAIYNWFRDIVYEATFEGHHTRKVRQGLRMGMSLFILSEVMFFFSFFFAYFHSALSPSVGIGCTWPPKGIETIDPYELPLLNTALLLTSGLTVTWAHKAIIAGNKKESAHALSLTVLLGGIFTYFQLVEYDNATFSITDGIYGSLFYMMTGFHGIHVIIGTLFLGVCLVRLLKNHFTKKTHFGFEAAAWYWHFVDIVWIFLYAVVYIWGS